MEDQHICKFDLLTVVQKYFEGVLLSSITIYDMPIAYQEDTDDYNDTKRNLGALPHCVFLIAICYGRTGSKKARLLVTVKRSSFRLLLGLEVMLLKEADGGDYRQEEVFTEASFPMFTPLSQR